MGSRAFLFNECINSCRQDIASKMYVLWGPRQDGEERQNLDRPSFPDAAPNKQASSKFGLCRITAQNKRMSEHC